MGALVKVTFYSATTRNFLLVGFASLLIAITLCGTGQLRAQETAVVLMEPQTIALDKGQTSVVAIRIEGAANVYGVQLDISFDAGKIRILDKDTAKPGVQILAGDFLTLDEGFEAANEANNESGQLTYAHSLLAPAEPASGSGTLAEFEVEALETGSIDLRLGTVILASPEGAQLPVQLAAAPEDDGLAPIIVAAATEETPETTRPAEDSPDIETPTAENILTPLSIAESPAVEAAPTVSPLAENPQLAAETETAAPVASGELSTTAVPVPPPVEESKPTKPAERSAVPAGVDPAAEFASAPLPLIEENSILSAAEPSPPLTVIGQNLTVGDSQAQPMTPAPSASSKSIMGGGFAAVGLVLLIIALIAIWFLRRLTTEI